METETYNYRAVITHLAEDIIILAAESKEEAMNIITEIAKAQLENFVIKSLEEISQAELEGILESQEQRTIN
jgi:hypothetical protein